MIVKREEFKGHPIISIWSEEDDRRPIVAVGVKKAVALMLNILEVAEFALDNAEGLSAEEEQAIGKIVEFMCPR